MVEVRSNMGAIAYYIHPYGDITAKITTHRPMSTCHGPEYSSTGVSWGL